MPEIISDTSALQYLHQVDRLDLLRLLYGRVVVPEGVAEEIAEGRALGYSLPDLSSPEWIRIEPVVGRHLLALATDLGKGEREVLALATERPEATALLDDGLARRVADHLGISFTGTLGVLLRAKAEGYLDRVSRVVDRLQTLGFHLDGTTRAAILELAGEA